MSKQSPTCIPCDIRTFRRNAYYNGKLLLGGHFELEQAYMVGKDWLHNNLLHGVGTVCGLKVLAHPNPECRDRFVYITPGVAVDCCGREIIVPQERLVPLPEPEEEQVDGKDLFISLCYEESLEEKIPVILPDCDCADANQAYNRIREGYRVHLFSADAGEREGVRPPLRARLDWHHTITLAKESPRALAVDDESQQLYVAAQGLPDEDFLGERLYVFRTDTHDLVTVVNAGQNPADLAVSLLGDRIFLTTTMAGEEEDAEPSPVLAFFKEADIRSSPEPAKTIPLEGLARLIVSPHTGALFALVLNNGSDQAVLRRWTDDLISTDRLDSSDPAPTPSNTLTFTIPFADLGGAAMLSVTLNGKYLFIADADGGTVRVVDVATFSDVTPLEDDGITPVMVSEGRPIAVFTSRDSQYLYVLWHEEVEEVVEGETRTVHYARLTRYRLDVSSGALQLIPDGSGGEWPTTPHDLAVSPDERWAYVLESDDSQSRVQAIAIDEIASLVAPELDDLLGTRENVSGQARYQRLAVLGGRLYVAADDEATDVQPERGLVAILDVEEAACDDLFIQALDGCPACQEGGIGEAGHCVVLAHIPKYRHGEPVLDAADAGPDDNAIDNLTHRRLVPSTNNITEVIRCMLEQGIAEGVPGPRGPTGPEGPEGPRGPGIINARREDQDPPGPGDEPTIRLDPAPEVDPDADKTLILGIPPGPQGPGIVDVTVDTLPPGSDATAELIPDPAIDPDADKTLALGIPRGEKGDPGPIDEPGLTHIERLSWEHDQAFAVDDFINLVVDPDAWLEDDFGDEDKPHPPGLVIAFDNKVDTQTILSVEETATGEPPWFTNSQVFQLYVRHRIKEFEFPRQFCDYLVSDVVYQPVIVEPDGPIEKVITLHPEEPEAFAVRIVFTSDEAVDNLLGQHAVEYPELERGEVFFRVVLRSDFVQPLFGKLRSVDGNHLGGDLPSGNGRQGGTFESWFTVIL